MKLYNLITEYLESLKYSIKKRTFLNYCQTATKHIKPNIGKEDISALDGSILNNFFISQNNPQGKIAPSQNTLRLCKTIINRALAYAFEKKYISNFCKITICFKNTNPAKIESFLQSEANRIEKYILENKKYYNFGVVLCLHTGIRIGELLALKWENVDLKNKIININSTICDIAFEHKMLRIEDKPKSVASIREIPITSQTATILKELKKHQKGNSPFVVSRPNGKQIFVRAYQDSFQRLLKKLCIRPRGFHALRHTFATNCYKLGMDIKTLSELLGHSSPAITLKIYVHTDIEHKRKALNMVAKKTRQTCARP